MIQSGFCQSGAVKDYQIYYYSVYKHFFEVLWRLIQSGYRVGEVGITEVVIRNSELVQQRSPINLNFSKIFQVVPGIAMVLLSWPIRLSRNDDPKWVDCVESQSGAVTVWVPMFLGRNHWSTSTEQWVVVRQEFTCQSEWNKPEQLQ